MGSGVKPLSQLPAFTDFMIQLKDQPILALIVGTLFTVIVQSSSATIGILQTIADEGMISLQGSLPILFGDNIRTTITAVLASIGATVAAKRTALVHVIFNVIGAIIFMILLIPCILWWRGWVKALISVCKSRTLTVSSIRPMP